VGDGEKAAPEETGTVVPTGVHAVIKLVTFLKRREGLTRPEFEQRWLTVHAPMAAVFPGLRGYMLSFPVWPEHEEPSADGVAQLWFASEEATQESYSTDVGRSGSKDAASNLSRRQHLFASEEWIVPPQSLSAYPFKLLVACRRLPPLDRATFIEAWGRAAREVAGTLFAGQPSRVCFDRRGKILNSSPDGGLGLIDADAVHDGMLEVWTDSEASVIEFASRVQVLPASLLAIGAGFEILPMKENVIVKPPSPAYGIG
jgi:uncharacterized protein (TIGR02118 family)